MKTGNGIWVEVDELIALKAYAGNIFRRAEKKSLSPLSGGYASPFRGRGIDFSEVRAYLPGDDIRSMDWRVTARTGKPHTKLFIEERERPVYFLNDFSSSMYYATRNAFKTVTASKIAALLAWAASGHGDRVGGFLFNESDIQQIKPMGGKRGVLQMVNHLSRWSKDIPATFSPSASNIEYILKKVRTTVRPGSLVYIVSDFRSMNENAERIVSELARHCDVVMIMVADPSELDAPEKGQLRISDGNNFGTIDVSNKTVKDRINSLAKRRLDRLSNFCLSHGIHEMSCLTTDDIPDMLRKGLSNRGSALRVNP